VRGSAAKIASALRGWHYLRFEVREESELGGEFYRSTPELGIHRASIDGLGSIVVTEHQIMDALAKSFDEISMREAIDQVLGNRWEEELAPFREVEIDKVMQLRAI
jgi:hypothetical protein